MVITGKTLYAKGNTSKTLVWYMERDGSKYRTIAGTKDGDKTTSAWTEAVGKNLGKANETSAASQAELEMNAKYTKKLSQKYYDNEANIDQSRFVIPMTCEKLMDRKDKVIYPVVVQLKFNGFRCIAQASGTWTRKGKQYAAIPHIEGAIQHLFTKHPNLVLDGELYNYELRQRLNEISRLVRRTKNITTEQYKSSLELVKLYVYDGYGFDSITEATPYEDRHAALAELITGIPYLEMVENKPANDFDEINKIFDKYVADGQEGIIVRDPKSSYEHKRSNNSLKYKPTDDAEFEITSVEEGDGNWSGVAKIIGLKMPCGKTFNGTFKGDKAQALEMLTNKDKYIGRKATVFYNGFTGLGTPNNAQFDYENWENDKA